MMWTEERERCEKVGGWWLCVCKTNMRDIKKNEKENGLVGV